MYVGSVSDFFFKNKDWLISLPKITNENKFQVVKMGNKFFQLNIYTGDLQEMNQNNNLNNCENSLNAKRSKTQEKTKKEKFSSKTYTNMKFSMKNQKEENDMLPKNTQDKDENDIPIEKKLKKNLAHKRNKSSNINNDFCLTSKYFLRNKKNKNKSQNSIANLYLNQKYISINSIKKGKSRNYLTCDNSKKFKLKGSEFKSTFIPKIKSKKIIINGINDNMSENIYFPEDNKYEINKEDNEITTNVKNELFKDKMFRILQKQYNFYYDCKNKNDIFANIPKLKLKTAKSIYIEKKKPLAQKLYLSKL